MNKQTGRLDISAMREERLLTMNTGLLQSVVDNYLCEQQFTMMGSANLCTHLIDVQKKDIVVWEEIFHSIKN